MAVIVGENIRDLGIEISPLDSPDNIQGSSYDFRIGEQIWLWSERKVLNPRTETVILRRNDIAIIQTYETLKTPANACGILINKVAMHAMGLYHPSTSIDPLFDGHMHVGLFNTGRFDIPLEWKADLATAMFFTTTQATEIHHKRTQDFSKLIQVFASYLGVMYPEKPETLPPSVSLDELKNEIVWRGNPFISMYSFLAGHDRQLGELRRTFGSYFFLVLATPWLVTIAALVILLTSAHLTWEQIEPAIGILTTLDAVISISALVIRKIRGNRLKMNP